jgi:hypothetical protein
MSGPANRQRAAGSSILGVMIKLSVMFPRFEGMTFDIDYYWNTHLAKAQRLMGAG